VLFVKISLDYKLHLRIKSPQAFKIAKKSVETELLSQMETSVTMVITLTLMDVLHFVKSKTAGPALEEIRIPLINVLILTLPDSEYLIIIKIKATIMLKKTSHMNSFYNSRIIYKLMHNQYKTIF
jgi:hypothetical protein